MNQFLVNLMLTPCLFSIFSGPDYHFRIRRKLDEEFKQLPIKKMSVAPNAYRLEVLSNLLYVIYIDAFFEDGTDFVM